MGENEGGWSNITSGSLLPRLSVARTASGEEWTTFESMDTTGMPVAGYVEVYLVHDLSAIGAYYRYFKDLNFTVEPNIQNKRRNLIKGDHDRYTISRDVVKNYDETIFLDDAETNIYKGAIYQSDGTTLTNDEWFRRRFNTERYTFKRQHAIARWFANKAYRAKLECNFYGLVWENDGNEFPIGLVNTINFVDDAPKKTFGISNLREIDFLNCTWSADLIEIFDEDTDEDGNVPSDLDVHTFKFYYE